MHDRAQTLIWMLAGLSVGAGACTGDGTEANRAASQDRPIDRAPAPPAAPGAPTPAGDPAGRAIPAIPVPGPIQSGECPLAIVPGRALGPIQLGSTRAQLEQTGLPLTQVHQLDDETMFRVGPYNAILCGEQVVEAWLDDLRQGPDCVIVDGKPVARDVARDALIALFPACHELGPRIGGAFTQCSEGGIRIGYGMGEFLQVRIGLPGIELDDDCRHVFDDGSPVPVPPDELGPMLEQTIDLPALSPFWHPELPGRRPLRVALPPEAIGPPGFHKLGEPVVYVSAAEPNAGSPDAPVFEFTAVRATSTTARLEFRYAAEGVVGSTSFRRRGDQWIMTAHELAER